MKPILILVAGGSASGKTTVVKEITRNLAKGVTVISQDDYYNDLSLCSLEEREQYNYDEPSSIDWNLLISNLKDLLNGGTIDMPTYDFALHNRSKKVMRISGAKVIILEGIFALYNEEIRDLSSINIFVECDEDIRFIRRLLRDTTERGRTQEMVIKQYLSTVKPMHHKFIKETKKYSDIIIPTNRNHDVAVDVVIAKINNIIEAE